MRTDRTTKILLLLIALGLWANVLTPAVSAQNFSIPPILQEIATHVTRISNGTCRNVRLCG
jgi:hypothetical protein